MQTGKRTFGELTQDQVYEKFIQQEKKKEWKEFKNLIVEDIVKKYGILPGHGKYSLPNIETEFNKI
jgi:hypothetical protein